MKKLALTALITISTMTACNTTRTSEFEWKIDQFDDVKILRYKVNGFEELSLEQKKLVYYLSQAALTGRDILFDQNFKHNLLVRQTLEGIYTGYTGDKNIVEFKNFEKYLKKVWFANGVHHHYSNDKFTPGFSAEYFAELTQNTPTEKLSQTPDELEIVEKVLFDPEFYPKRVNQTEGQDMVTTSAVNFYEGVTEKEVEAFYKKMADPRDNTPISYGLNSKVIKENGKIKELVWKVGGMYGAAMQQTINWLEKALTVTENDLQKQTIQKLIEHYQSGSLKHYDQYNVLWVQDNGGLVDFVNGYTETYTDPLGRKATWESIVNFKDLEATKRTQIISDNAQWFEDHSPIPQQYKKEEVKGVSAKVITVAMLGGDCYPATPMGINLPNADWIRRDHGSKSVTIANVTEAYEKSSIGNGFSEEFILQPEEQARKAKYGSIAGDLHTDLHECLGHGSGKLASGVKGDELRNYGSPLEETRADLFALYFVADPKMQELGVVENDDVWKTAYYNQIMNGALTQLTRIQLGKNIEQAHMRNRALIANWAFEIAASTDTPALEKITQDGKTYIQINDYQGLRQIFGQQLNEIQRIKSEGDYEAGRALIEKYAVRIDPTLHTEILERYSSLGIAPYSGFVNPTYVVTEKDGNITDITLDYTQGYTDQMLQYSLENSYLTR